MTRAEQLSHWKYLQLSTTMVQIACGICALLVILTKQNCNKNTLEAAKKMENIINGSILPKAEALINKKHTLLRIVSTNDVEEFQVEKKNKSSLGIDIGIIIIYTISGIVGFIGINNPSKFKIVVRCTMANLLSSGNMFLMVEFAERNKGNKTSMIILFFLGTTHLMVTMATFAFHLDLFC